MRKLMETIIPILRRVPLLVWGWRALVRFKNTHVVQVRNQLEYCSRLIKFTGPYSVWIRLLSIVFSPLKVLELTGFLPFESTKLKSHQIINVIDKPSRLMRNPQRSQDGVVWESRSTTYPEERMGYVARLQNGYALSTGYNLDHTGRVVVDASQRYKSSRNAPKFKRYLKTHGAFSDRILADRSRTIPTYTKLIVLTASASETYFHWMLDVLPRIGMGSYYAANAKMYISQKLEFQRTSLQELGFCNDDVVVAADDLSPMVKANELVIPCQQYTIGYPPSDQAIDFLRSSYLHKAAVLDVKLPKRFYLTRRKAKFRRVLNEQDLVEVFTRFRIELVDDTELSFIAGVKLFADAELILAQEGSGLANLVFCEPGTKFLEIFPATTRELFYSFADAMSLEYGYVTNGAQLGAGRKLNADVTIDILKLTTALENMG
jgi:capsular polysaccharide biosynthesis protein